MPVIYDDKNIIDIVVITEVRCNEEMNLLEGLTAVRGEWAENGVFISPL